MTVDSRTMDDSLAVWPSQKVKEEYEKTRLAETNYGTVADQKARPFWTLYYKFLYKIFYLIRETKDMSGVLGERGTDTLYGEVYRRLHTLMYFRGEFDKIRSCRDKDWPDMKVAIMKELQEVLDIIDKALVQRLIIIKRLSSSKCLGAFDNLCPDTRAIIAEQIKLGMSC